MNGRLRDVERLQASIAESAPLHDTRLIFRATSNEKLYVLHRSALEKAAKGDLSKIKQLLEEKK